VILRLRYLPQCSYEFVQTIILALLTVIHGRVMKSWFFGPTTVEWSDGETCTRRQIPIVPAAASTINKAQGITAKQVVTDISGDLIDPALAYVAVSRAKSLDGVLLEKGFDFERLQYEETNARKARQIRLRTP
jgi:hypothetical protein